MWGIKIEIRNKELIDAKGQYIYISNHRSYLDAFIAANVIPNFLKYLGKAEMSTMAYDKRVFAQELLCACLAKR